MKRGAFGPAVLLSVTLGVSALAACGGGATGPGPAVPGSGSASTSAASGSASTAPASSGSVAASASASTSVAPPPGHMKQPVGSQMGTELTALGLDPKNLPVMSKLEPDKLRKVMKLISKSLGLQCNGCHLEDAAAATPRKRAAEKMWDEYLRGFAMADGTPLFCDSCHQGAVVILDRTDKRALGKWMEAAFVGKLKAKAQGKQAPADLECASCHSEDHEMHFIDLWKQGKPFSPHK
jgi:hypothetical protein